MANLNDTYASVLSGYSGSVNDRRSELLTGILAYAKPLSLNDMEAAALASLGYTGALNDAWDKYIKALGGFGFSTKADYLSSTFYGNPVPFLFKASEPGVWYDPSDLTTLFQDSAGTTPVTATGQTVGLMLDKSKANTLGSELVTNGDFSSATGWTPNTGWVISGGQATFTANSTSSPIYNTATAPAIYGRVYELRYTVVSNSLNAGNFRVGGFTGGSYFASITNLNTTPGNYVLRIVANPSAAGITFDFWVTSAATSGSIVIDNISFKQVVGNYATQVTSTQRPTYQIDSTGRPYLSFDGVDDGMVTGTITPGTDKVQVFAGVRKLSDVARGVVVELSVDTDLNAGSFALTAPNGAGLANFAAYAGGSVRVAGGLPTGNAAPVTKVISFTSDIPADVLSRRQNATDVGTITTDQGTGNFLAYPLYIGRRGGSSLPYNGRLYSLIVRFGSNLTTGQITSTEKWVNSKTGAY